jgi:F-type H+-transporting ATPase subunit c
MKKALVIVGILVMFAAVTVIPAFASEEAAKAQLDPFTKAMVALAAGLGLGIAAMGGALGQGKTAASAVEGIARNPGAAGQIRTAMILGLALIESLVIYSLVVSFFLFGKL